MDNTCGDCGCTLFSCGKCVFESDHDEWHFDVTGKVFDSNATEEDN